MYVIFKVYKKNANTNEIKLDGIFYNIYEYTNNTPIFDSNMDKLLSTNEIKRDDEFQSLLQQDSNYYSNVLNCMNNLYSSGHYIKHDTNFDIYSSDIYYLYDTLVSLDIKFNFSRY